MTLPIGDGGLSTSARSFARGRGVNVSSVSPCAVAIPVSDRTSNSAQRMPFMQPTVTDRALTGLKIQVRLWPISDEPRDGADVCDRGGSGHGSVRPNGF